MRTLVIDDDADILDLVTRFLATSPHDQATPALSAKAAIEAISDAEAPFDCFLIDIQMPEIDGIALAALIRETPGYRHTPIVMLTAMEEKRYLDEAFAAGATDYVTKPFDLRDLRQRIQAARKLSIEKARHRETAAAAAAGASGGMAGHAHAIRLKDPMPVKGVAAAIDYGEFENYVRQVLRRRPSAATTLAVKIGNATRVFSETAPDDFTALVRDAALAIEETVLTEGGVLSYRGNGVFLCVLEKRLRARRGAVQKGLNRRYRDLCLQTGRAAGGLILGDQLPLGTGSDVNALDAMALAVASADGRDMAFTDIFDLPKRLLAGQLSGGEQRHLEKRAFEALLQDALGEPGFDAWPNGPPRRGKPPD